MSFFYINVETILKCKNLFKKSILKKFTSPAEFLLQECRNNREMQKSKKYITYFDTLRRLGGKAVLQR